NLKSQEKGNSAQESKSSFTYPIQNEHSRFASVFTLNPDPPLGKGGFGILRICHHIIDGTDYAVKQIRLWEHDSKTNILILREVCALAKLDHHNVIRYYNA